MARISHLLKNRIFFILALLLAPSMALAMLIYEWKDELDPDSTVTGTMIFADGVSFGDIIDPLSDDLVEFSFSNPALPDWSMSDFAYGDFLRPEASGVDLDPSGFAIPTSDATKKKAVAKRKGGIFTFERDDASLDFTVESGVKKKVAKRKATKKGPDTPIEELYPLWFWDSAGIVECTPGTACKKSATKFSGEGYWVLKSGTVPVPEPTTFLLLLAGLGVMLSFAKHVRGKF